MPSPRFSGNGFRVLLTDPVADCLFEYVTDRLIDGLEIPGVAFGNALEHSGRIIAVAVDCDLSKVDSVTAAAIA